MRMPWATGRKTRRPEDVAYSLPGIFGVNMPMIYGEGGRAFIRLQEEIIKISTRSLHGHCPQSQTTLGCWPVHWRLLKLAVILAPYSFFMDVTHTL